MKRVGVREWSDGPDATCQVCQFRAWRGLGSSLSAADVRTLARQHVRATGHAVEVQNVSITFYEPAGNTSPRKSE